MNILRRGAYAAAVIALAGVPGCGRSASEGTNLGTGVYHPTVTQVAANSPSAEANVPPPTTATTPPPTPPPVTETITPAPASPPPEATSPPPSTDSVPAASPAENNALPSESDDRASAAAAMALAPGVVLPGANSPGAPSAPGLSPGANGALPAAGNSGGALAAVTNQWRAGNANLLGVTRVDEKTVVSGYSWMTQLLPHLGHDDVYRKFDFSKGWHTGDNLQHTGNVIPEFLDPANPQQHVKSFRFVEQRGPALTHFVGMSGVEDRRNLVAAGLPRSDPRAGIFGYDQIAKPADVTDGASQTIMLIGSGRVMGPWVEGGGATIRGAREPYFDEISGFGSASMNGGGAIVAMADGSVRRIAKDIDPAVFRALCTMHGAETIDLKVLDSQQGGK